MRYVRYLAGFILLFILSGGAIQAQSDVFAPGVFLRGMQFERQTRYTAAVVKPSDDTVMRNVSVEITLPADARLQEMLVARQVQFDVIRRSKQGQLTLIWQMAQLAADQPLDTFAFTLAEPLTGELEFYMQWQGEDGSQVIENFREVPQVTAAGETEAQFAVPAIDFSPVAATGIQIKAPLHPVTILTLRLLPGDFNPPPEYGDIWWCSILEILGLPENAPVDVLVPLRRPVAPFTALQLFRQQPDGTWKPLDGQAVVTADGQFVLYKHPGGVVATGGDAAIQPEILPPEQVTIVEENSPADVVLVPPVETAPPLPEEAPPVENPPPAENPEIAPITDGTSNTIITGEATPVPPPENAPATDGTSNTIITGEATPVPPPETAPISDGSSNTIVLGENTPVPPPETAPISDGSSNTIIIGESTPVQDSPVILPTLSAGAVEVVQPTPGVVVVGGKATSIPPTLTATPGTGGNITDGTSNTIFIGESTPAPLPATPAPITDGTSNTIIIGESSPTPTQPSPVIIVTLSAGSAQILPTVTGISVIGGKPTGIPPTLTATPGTGGNITDGTSNTIIIGESTPVPPPATPAPITDGSSNTIFIGESTPTPPPATPAPITDGSSNTIFIGESTPTPPPVIVVTRSTSPAGATATATPVPVIPTTVPPVVFPPPFGAGGIRVEIVFSSSTAIQCQIGRVNCAALKRSKGTKKP